MEYHSSMTLFKKRMYPINVCDGSNSIVYFVITIKGTGREPDHLRWMGFSFSNLMALSPLSVLVSQGLESQRHLPAKSICIPYILKDMYLARSKMPMDNIRAESFDT